MPDRAIFIVLGIFVGALLLVALGKVLWDRRPKKCPAGAAAAALAFPGEN